MNIDKKMKQLKDVISSKEILDVYGYSWKARYMPLLTMFIEKIEKGEMIEVDKDDVDNLNSFIERTKDILLFSPLDDDIRQSIRILLEFLYSVNANAMQNKEFERDILLCIKLLDSCLTINELLGVAREVIDKLEKILECSPPAFKLAPHYLKIMLEEIEKDNNE